MSTQSDVVIPVEYRTWHNGIPPRRIKLDIGGWAGENNWKRPQGWHCKPYSDAATYGLELIYPWETTCEVTCDDKGKCKFIGDFTKEFGSELKGWEAFGSFAPWHFGFVSMIDIKTQPGYNLMIQPHPRVFSDKDGSVPVAVPGMLEMDWWPEVFFVVFKAPLPGCKYVFKKDDPIAQFLIVPKNIKYDIKEMSKEEKEIRMERQTKLENNWNRMCTRVFYAENPEEFFDNKYKVLSNIAKREGIEEVGKIIDNPKKLPHWFKNPTVVDARPEDQRKIEHAPWEEEPKEVYKEPIKPNDFWKDVPPIEEDQDILEQGLGDLEKIINQTDDFSVLSDDDMNNIITAFKRQKRKIRMERSNKLKKQCQPTKLNKQVEQIQKPKVKKKEEWILGHRMEKLI